VPDIDIAHAMAVNFGLEFSEILADLRDFETWYEVVDNKMPFWLVWRALAEAAGTWTKGVAKA